MPNGGADATNESISIRTGIEWLSWTIIILANVVLLILILKSPNYPVYDEITNFKYVSVLQQHGLSATFLRELPGGAGPTFSLVFAPIRLGLGLEFPWIRLVNFVLFLASTIVLWRILIVVDGGRDENRTQTEPALLAGVFTALPTVGVSAGMALTEVPALLFIMLALLALANLVQHRNQEATSTFVAVACGFSIGFAVLGRQNYLVMLPCLVLLFDWPVTMPRKRDLINIIVVGVTATVVVGPVFFIWGGLIPPLWAKIGTGIAPWHGVLAVGYAGVISALLAPRLFRVMVEQNIYVIAVLILALGLTFLIGGQMVPMHATVVSLGGESIVAILSPTVTFIISTFGFSFLFCIVHHAWQNKNDPFIRFCACVAIIGILSNMKNTAQFSSRYVFVFLPFLFLSLTRIVRVSWHLPIRLGIGAVLSLVSLSSYLRL